MEKVKVKTHRDEHTLELVMPLLDVVLLLRSYMDTPIEDLKEKISGNIELFNRKL